ncbi:DUF1801 domain-containing protein [Nocardia seriolae]|uniref:DUF1801 domain-containing protein n=1 Tax=Nocardia seriolae TaxID=37332 RepID=UPI001C430331
MTPGCRGCPSGVGDGAARCARNPATPSPSSRLLFSFRLCLCLCLSALEELPDERRPALTALRELCRDQLSGFREVMNYGMPTYERDNGAEIAFASQKQYVSFYLMRGDIREAFAERLAGYDMGKAVCDSGNLKISTSPWWRLFSRQLRPNPIRFVELSGTESHR